MGLPASTREMFSSRPLALATALVATARGWSCMARIGEHIEAVQSRELLGRETNVGGKESSEGHFD